MNRASKPYASRVERLGVGGKLSFRELAPNRLARRIRELLERDDIRARATELAAATCGDDAATAAARFVEDALGAPVSASFRA